MPTHRLKLLRQYATSSTRTTPPAFRVFNRNAKLLQRERAASNIPLSRTVDYLRDHIANDLVERLLIINRRFHRTLDLGAGACYIARALAASRPDAVEGSIERAADRVEHLVAGEFSQALLHRDEDLPFNDEVSLERQVLDEESLPFNDESFDAVVSAGSMHWVNDLPSCLREVNRVLKPDAPFVAAIFGGDTLYELRTSLQLAEQERLGGVSLRVSPFADTRDIGGLLDKAGFNLLTIDVDDVIIDYPDSFAVMQDLGAMGEGNAILGKKEGPISRDVLMASEGIYKVLHGNEDGTVPATFRVIYMVSITHLC